MRPADANETVAAWRTILEHTDRPAGLALSRQNLPGLPAWRRTATPTPRTCRRGAYVLLDVDGGAPDVVLIGTGSEVQIAVAAREQLAAKDIRARVVSMPCREWFEEQDKAYRDTVMPPTVKARVSVEAAVALGWRDIVGDAGRIVSIDHFGASADYQRLYLEFGMTAEVVTQAAIDSIAAADAKGLNTRQSGAPAIDRLALRKDVP